MPASLMKAIALTRNGKAAQAFEELNRAILADSDLEAIGHRAWLYRSVGEFENSLADYDRLVERNPADLTAAAYRADLLRLMGRTDEAAAESAKILNSNPFHSIALKTLALCHVAKSASDGCGSPPSLSVSSHVNPVLDYLADSSGLSYHFVSHTLGHLLYAFARIVQPRVAVEVGCFAGFSTIAIGQALRDNGRGYLHSFDIFASTDNYCSPIAENVLDLHRLAVVHIQTAGLDGLVSLHKGDSSSTIEAMFGNDDAKIDFAFLDGDHSVKGVIRDWNAVARSLRPGGIDRSA